MSDDILAGHIITAPGGACGTNQEQKQNSGGAGVVKNYGDGMTPEGRQSEHGRVFPLTVIYEDCRGLKLVYVNGDVDVGTICSMTYK